jgi:4-hydroxybenzoate polyprenyltransferase
MTRREQQTAAHALHEVAINVVPAVQPSWLQRMQGLVKELRPRQWTKNFAIFIGLVFAHQFFTLPSLERTVVAWLIFCLAASSIYLLNDLLDIQQDRLHPTKRQRPLASGLVPVFWAKTAFMILLFCCALLIYGLFSMPIAPAQDIYTSAGGANVLFTLAVVAYLLLMILYGLKLKHVVLLDVFVIAAGFILRILAGAVVVPVVISPWLYLVTCFLSLFLALGKRRHELVLLQGQAHQHRQILQEYSLPLLDQLITIVVAGTIIAYSLYTIEGSTGDHRLAITIPLVIYGMFRYLYLVYIRMEGGSPEEVLLRDRHILATVLLCIILVGIILYALPR